MSDVQNIPNRDHLEIMSWKQLQKLLSDDIDYSANIELARRVVNNYEKAVNYYLGPISSKIVNRINCIMGENSFTEYYLFLSHPQVETTEGVRPGWHKVSLYDAQDCSLLSYTSTITSRHFYKLANKMQQIKNNESGLLEYKDYEALLVCDQEERGDESVDKKCMKRAFARLNKRERRVLKYLVIDKMPSIEAYPLISDMIHPIAKDGMTSEQVKGNWNIKQRQTSMSLLKGRALEHLRTLYAEQKNLVHDKIY